MSLRFPLSTLIYPRECLETAISTYSALCSIDIADETQNGCHIEIESKSPSQQSEDQLVHEFLNYLLDISIERNLGSSLTHRNE